MSIFNVRSEEGYPVIGGTVELDAASVNFDATYTFEKEHEGVTYRWTGVRPTRCHKEAVFVLAFQRMHADGGPYSV